MLSDGRIIGINTSVEIKEFYVRKGFLWWVKYKLETFNSFFAMPSTFVKDFIDNFKLDLIGVFMIKSICLTTAILTGIIYSGSSLAELSSSVKVSVRSSSNYIYPCNAGIAQNPKSISKGVDFIRAFNLLNIIRMHNLIKELQLAEVYKIIILILTMRFYLVC